MFDTLYNEDVGSPGLSSSCTGSSLAASSSISFHQVSGLWVRGGGLSLLPSGAMAVGERGGGRVSFHLVSWLWVRGGGRVSFLSSVMAVGERGGAGQRERGSEGRGQGKSGACPFVSLP